MSEDPTKNLTTDEKLDLILAEMAEVKTRLIKLEEDRARETRPLLESLHAHVDRMSAELQEVKAIVKRLDSGFTQFSRELMDIKARQYDIEQRVTNLDSRQ